jgi:hypothetical protein
MTRERAQRHERSAGIDITPSAIARVTEAPANVS